MHPLTEFRRVVSFLAIGQSRAPTAEWVLWHLRELYRKIPGLVLTVADVREAFESTPHRFLTSEHRRASRRPTGPTLTEGAGYLINSISG